MDTLAIALLSFVGFIVAYHTYGRYLARRIFGLDAKAVVPAHELNDGMDFVPTPRSVVFGHHFTSIAGTGPIVGPAIAVFWGWLPALIWVLVGSIFIGAVHDLGALVVSLRSRGQTIGDVAGRMISPRARLLFLLILFFALTVVIGIFGLVIAVIFSVYPGSVLSVWTSMPLAIAIGIWVYRFKGSLLLPSLGALGLLYGAVYVGVYHLPVSFPSVPLFAGPDATFMGGLNSQVVLWTGVLLVYCFIASVMPVWLLLQPRDYINSHQLLVALGLVALGLVMSRPELVAPAYTGAVAGAPPMFPFLFITIACGAVSGFHCLVSSGTSSKQLCSEPDAQYVGYGAMLLEGALAVLVILACCAGLGMGVAGEGGAILTGSAAWNSYYGGNWADLSLRRAVSAFVEGGGNMVSATGLPKELSAGIIAVMVACFAATTLDSAARLQRYVIQELAAALRIRPLTNKYAATTAAVVTGGALALIPGPQGPGSGGLILWPLFGAINQMLAGLAFLVIAFYLARHSKPVWFLIAPMILMVVLPAWAMGHQLIEFAQKGDWLLVGIGIAASALHAWMVLEAALLWRRAQGVLPQPLPPLPGREALENVHGV